MSPTRPVFIRLPEAQVQRLEQACGARMMTKQAFVSAAVMRQLDDNAAGPLGAGAAPADEVLTLDELAQLLKLPTDELTGRVEAGDLPGRRFGGDWRFSRAGVLGWLAAGEHAGRQSAGFEARRSS